MARIELWDQQDAVAPEDVLVFWAAEDAMPEAVARERVREVLAVAVGEDGAVQAVSTTLLARNRQLGLDLWQLRVFVGAAHRRGALAIDLARTGRDELVRRATAGTIPGAGVLFVVESRVLAEAFPDAIWPRLDFAYVGRTARGRPIRVHYFPGALAPEPWPEALQVPQSPPST